MKRPDLTIKCPCCGLGDVDCWIDPGEPRVTSGPPDGWYPGSPAGLDDWAATCNCADSGMVDDGTYTEAIEQSALQYREAA
jgi:hypothetical protein